MIRSKIQFQSKRDKGKILFEYLGLVKDYNGMDLVQTKKYIKINCLDYIKHFFKSHGWDVVSNQPDLTPTVFTNTRTWDQWMENANNIDRGNNNANVTHATAASITTTGLYSVNTLPSAPDLPDDELVALHLKDTNKNNDFAPYLILPKDKVNKNNIEEYMKSSKSIKLIPSGSIKQMFCDKGPPEGTVVHQVVETQLKFNYLNVFSEFVSVKVFIWTFCFPP